MDKTARIRISAKGWDIELIPALGGAVSLLSHDLRNVLRPMGTGNDQILGASCFSLVPYPNRIAHGRFAFGGQVHRLPLNFGDHPHSLHGLGWQSAWRVVAKENDHIGLVHRHDGGPGWPWPYIAGQEIGADQDGAYFRLSLRNDGESPMPAGLGFHPYFPARDDTRLTARCETVWLSDADCIPTGRAPARHFADWSQGASVRHDVLIDHCHAGWDGKACIEQPADGFAIHLSASPELRHLHLYMPPGRDFFCAEPVSCMPDALNRPEPMEQTGLRVIAPGDTMTAEMRIGLEER